MEVAGCKWCARSSSSPGHCSAQMGDDCLIVTLSALGCSTAVATESDAASGGGDGGGDVTDEDSSLPIAVIGGAVGGGIAALCLIALVVFLVMRSRSKGRSKPDSGEMATARESNSVANSETYGDLRLVSVNVYSTAGLGGGGSPGASGDSAEPEGSGGGGASVNTYQAPPSQAHYTQMEMNK